MSVFKRLFTVLIIASVFSIGPAGAEVTPGQAKLLKQAKDEYASAVEKEKETLFSRFDKAVETLRSSKLASGDQLKLIGAVKLEKAQFELKGYYPCSEPMRPHLLDYLNAQRSSHGKLDQKYEKVIKERLRAKDRASAH